MRRLFTPIPLVLSALSAGLTFAAHADGVPDPRIRTVSYSPDQVYQLYGYVGYQIDLQFERGESFVGLGAGDLEGIAFVAAANHLFFKPKVAKVGTNLTVLTDRRQYQFDYVASAHRADAHGVDVLYVLRFAYSEPHVSPEDAAARTTQALVEGEAARPRNTDYWFCGHPAVKPIAASDDGVHTRLRFGTKSELPAIFVHNEDGSESLLNFSMDAGEVVIHRVARQFIIRRGQLTGCIVNKAFAGGGERVDSNTVSETVDRATREVPP